jgi:hypothetical protein
MGHLVYYDFVVVTLYFHIGDYQRFQDGIDMNMESEFFLLNAHSPDEHNLNFNLKESVEH